MSQIIEWLPLIVTLIIYATLFYSRHWLGTQITSSVEHKFNQKLERLSSELRIKENEISTLRDAVLTGRNQRQALVDKRKIEAVENLWKEVVQLQRFKALSNALASIKLDEADRLAADDAKVRKFFEVINKLAPNIEEMKPSSASNERPFISHVAWAYFSALQTILYGAIARTKALELGVRDSLRLMNTEHEKKLLKAALPHQAEFIDKFDASAYFFLIEELENNLLKELDNILDGKASDDAALRRATEIQKAIDENAHKTAQA